MDPVTHTLVGATLAQTGLKQRTALGTATLLIGADLPDVDVLAYFWGADAAVGFRRGLTHGILALVALPFLLTGLVLLYDRLLGKRRPDKTARVVPKQVLLLAMIAVATHPVLDFLNSYGVRFFAPFSYRWFYGDTLFIIDPWVWGVLAVGVWAGWRGPRGPRVALGVATLYVLLMAVSNQAARTIVERAVGGDGAHVERIMAAPSAVTPFTRWVVVEDDRGYRVGLFDWLRHPRFELERLPYDLAPDSGAAAVSSEPRVRRFLSWARFPYYLVQRTELGYTVHIGDARYSLDPERSWASTRVTIAAVDSLRQ